MKKRKLLGQHFLVDEEVFERECKYAEINKDDVVLEIGAGDGRLTSVIAKYAKKVIAIEKDPYLYSIAKERIPENVDLILGDALEMKFPKFNKIVANIPYSISSPLIEKIFHYDWSLAVITFQKEFAERFFAKPGEKNYSRLTILVNYFSEVKKLELVKKGKFYPKPQVDSLMVLFKKKNKENIGKGFWNMISVLFRHKKKLVKNALEDEGFDATVPQKFEKKRVFQMSLEEFIELYNSLKNEFDK